MRNRYRCLLAIATMLPLAGCYNQVRDPIQPRQDSFRSGRPEQLFFDSENLRNDTAADTPSVLRDQDRLLHVTVPIRSVINKQLYVEYRAIFFDRDWQEIDRTPWKDKTLPANLPERVTVTSSSPQAEHFQVQFRYPISTEYRQ